MTISRLQKCLVVALLVTLICQKKLGKSLRGPLLCSLQRSDASDVGRIIKRHERHGRVVCRNAIFTLPFAWFCLWGPGYWGGACVNFPGPSRCHH